MDYIKDSSLVLDLPLYELDGSSFMSCDAYGHLCTDTGAVWTLQGRRLDGVDDNITIPDAPSLSLGSAFTLECWVKKTGAGELFLISKDNTILREFNTSFNASERLYWEVYGGVAVGQLADTTLSLDTWYHSVFTWDGAYMRPYVNGVIDATPKAKVTALDDTAQQVEIGIRAGLGFMAGVIGEVRIYNRALTPLEIQHNYLATKGRYT